MAYTISLAGRRALVTGGGRGIGRSIALALAGAGADIAVAARSQAELETVAGEIAQLGRHAMPLVLDLMNREAIGVGVRQAAEKLGGLDILVNNAGGTMHSRTELLNPLDHDSQAFEDNLFLNLTQAFYATKAAIPFMMERKWGRIINIGSSGGDHHGMGPVSYTTAKHGLVGFTRSMAYALAPHGININVISAGLTQTKALDWEHMTRLYKVATVKEAQAKAVDKTALKRLLDPDEFGPVALLLASDQGAAITGQVIGVDAGYLV
ncbi:MAG TPA: SDR family NAD(P)-dependent oxidoreductase [Candidatus Binataceae bacterium]|jgi:meso-butanediol dehydrogenase/(S,S)-butanediol dehydrogenase/diacetyl reductase|nr:SDR family NAD(P)-dependent oxidoreductase [Candidatus Binataceae bacterium]